MADRWSHASRASLTRLRVLFLLIGVFASPPFAHADAQSNAIQLIQTVRQAAMTLGKGGAAGAQLRAISKAFDGKGIAQAVLGAHWRNASADDRTAVVDAILYAIAHRLANKVQRTQDEDFAVLGSKVLANGDILVRSEFRHGLRQPTSVDWRVRRCDGRLCIGDVAIDGGSTTVQQRDRVARVLASNGESIPALVVDLRNGRI